ncbi:MAG: hypothetical protein K2H20_02685 [Bacilli bacterium]|nr:hypothetical protein [Bacilli bacterium]
MDYEGANGLYQDLESATNAINSIEKKLNDRTLESDIADLNFLNTNYLKNLSENLDTTKTQLENGLKSMKTIEDCINNGQNWN